MRYYTVETNGAEKTAVSVNGEVRQDSNTGNLIAGIAEIISMLSEGMTLQAGTIIATGTPAGVGMGMTPPTFLKEGGIWLNRRQVTHQ